MIKKILTFSWPSGSGKTTLANLFVSRNNYAFPTNFTTRDPRPNDTEYKHITFEAFCHKMYCNELIEILHYNNNYYWIIAPEYEKIAMAIDVVALPQLIKFTMEHNISLNSFFIDVDPEIAEKRMIKRWESVLFIQQRLKNDQISHLIGKALCHHIVDWSLDPDTIYKQCLEKIVL